MAKHFLVSVLLMVLVSSASAASSSEDIQSCKTKDSCYYDKDMDLCVEERYVPIQDEVDLCDADEKHEEKAMDDGPAGCQGEGDLCDDMCDNFTPLDLCDEKTEYEGGCHTEYVFNKKIKEFLASNPTDPTARSIKVSLPSLMGQDVLKFTGGEPVPDDKLAEAEGLFKGAGEIFKNLGLMRKCGDPEPETVKTVVTAAPKLGNVINGLLEMKLKKNEVDEAEDAVTSVLASALNVPEAAIIKAQLIKQSGRRLQDQSSDLSKYRLQYQVAVPPGQSAKQLLNKANNLPQTIPQRFAQYGVTVADVVHVGVPSTFTLNHGLFQATTTTLPPITEKMTWLQVVSRAVLLIIPCFAGYLGSIPGFEQKFCCK